MSEEEAEDDGNGYGDKDSPSDQVRKLEYENAKQRLSTQQETIKSFSEEGARYLRLILVLIGVPLAVLGALDPNTLTQLGNSIVSDKCMYNSPPCLQIKYVTVTGSMALLITGITNIAAGGYEAYNTRNISNPNDIHKTISSGRSSSEHLTTRLRDYRERIEHNDRIIFSLDRTLLIGKLGLLFSIIIMSMVAHRLLMGTTVSPNWLIGMLLSILLVFTTLSFVIPDSIPDRGSMLRFAPSYSLEYKNGQEDEKKKSTSSSEIEEETQ